MAESHSCPSDDTLQSLIDGRLSAEEQAALATHLEHCENCRRKLDSLARGDMAIPSSDCSMFEPPEPSDALAEAMRRLKADQMDETATVAGIKINIGGAALSFLAPSANPRHLGRLAGYEVLEVIGRGGMGIVLKARDPKLERLVAVKVLNPELATSGAARARFLREARSAAAVTHEHVVTIHAVDDAGELPFLVMEYIVGVSLEDRIRRSGHLRLEEILRIGMQAALGLAAAHAQGLVHRDIKPSNILLENGVERVKITDFGLARVVHEAQITQTNLVAGTPQYMSPEQARGEAVDHRSDLFSLGCVLYAMCTGRSPFRAETTTGAIHRVCNDTPHPIREVNPELPDWLAVVIDRLLEKKPEDRFQTASEVAEVLGQYLAHVQQPSRVALPHRFPRAPKLLGRRTWLTTAVAMALVTALLGITAWWNHQDSDRSPPATEQGGMQTPGPPSAFGKLVINVTRPFGADSEVTVSGNGMNELVISGPNQRTLQLAPGTYSVTLTIPFRERILRKGSLRIVAGTTQRLECGLFDMGDTPPERQCVAELLGHGGPVTQVIFSRDGKTLFAACQDGRVYPWRSSDSQWKLDKPLGGYPGAIRCLALSPDATFLAVAGDTTRIVLQDAKTGEKRGTLVAPRAPVRSLALSPDVKWLSSADDTGTVIVWDLIGQKIIRRWEAYRKRTSNEGRGCVAFSPDGQVLATGGYDETVKLWDTREFRLIRELHGVSRWVTALAFTPNGSTLIAADAAGTKIWDRDSGQLLGSLPSDWLYTWSMAISADGRTVASGQSRSVRLFDLESQTMIDAFPAHWGQLNSVAFCPTGRILATGGVDQAVRLWSYSTPLASKPKAAIPRLICTFKEPSTVFSAHKDRLALVAPASGALYAWQLNDFKLVSRFKQAPLNATALSYLGAHNRLVTVRPDGELAVWTVEEGQSVLRQQASKQISNGEYQDPLAVSQDGRKIVVEDGGQAVMFDGRDLTYLGTFTVPNERVFSLAFCSQRPILAIGTDRGHIALFDVETQTRLATISHGRSRILGLAFSPDGKTLVSTSEESTVKLWDVDDVEAVTPIRDFPGHTTMVFSADFSPDGRWLVTSGGVQDFAEPDHFWQIGKPGEVKIWDVAEGRLVSDLNAPELCAFQARFLADGNQLIVCSGLKLDLWDVSEVLKAVPISAEQLRGGS